MNIGENIRKVRKSKGLTMKQLGEKINMSEQAISQYERNLRTPNTKLLFKIANILEVTPAELDPSIKEMTNILEKFDNSIDVAELKKEVTTIGETEKLLNILGYELKNPNPTADVLGISQEKSEGHAIELTELIKNDKIPIYEVYYDGKLVANPTNSQFNNLKQNIKFILDYELYKLSRK